MEKIVPFSLRRKMLDAKSRNSEEYIRKKTEVENFRFCFLPPSSGSRQDFLGIERTERAMKTETFRFGLCEARVNQTGTRGLASVRFNTSQR